MPTPVAAAPSLATQAPAGRARVLAAWDETAGLRGLRLGLEQGLDDVLVLAPSAPGQALKLLTPAGEAYFAIGGRTAGRPEGEVELLVKRGPPVAEALISCAREGAVLQASGPFGPGFAAGHARGRDVLLFAAGSGIAPVRALIQELLRQRSEVGRMTLFYGQRAPADFAYRAEHLAWERSGVRVYLCCSDPAVRGQGWEGPVGRVHEVAERAYFGGSGLSATVAFACGMREMVDGVRVTLEAAGLPPGRVLLNF